MGNNVTATHNSALYNKWFETNYMDRACTFDFKGKRVLGRLTRRYKFVGYTGASGRPDYEVGLTGPSGAHVIVTMDEDNVTPFDTLAEAEKDCGYTWDSRYVEQPKRNYKSYDKQTHRFRMKEKLKEAEKEYKEEPLMDPSPKNNTPINQYVTPGASAPQQPSLL